MGSCLEGTVLLAMLVRLSEPSLYVAFPRPRSTGLAHGFFACLEHLRRLGIEGREALILAGLVDGEFRSASQGPRKFQPLTPEELAMYEN